MHIGGRLHGIAQRRKGHHSDPNCAEHGSCSESDPQGAQEDRAASLGRHCGKACPPGDERQRRQGLYRVPCLEVVRVRARHLLPVVRLHRRPAARARLADQAARDLEHPKLSAPDCRVEAGLELLLHARHQSVDHGLVVVALRGEHGRGGPCLGGGRFALAGELRGLHRVDLLPDLLLEQLGRLFGADLQLFDVVVAGRKLAVRAVLQPRVLAE
mmetsp:Transcript_61331/g.154814  ORF Transcript_61331/g.154814 Transcript_61331/m.154814 type:complete len:214 (+) Transcript_61331:965-1606(+)